MEIHALHVESFWHDGRGPVLEQVHYNENGTLLTAIDYRNSDGAGGHLVFIKCQVFMFTPEEVENYGASALNGHDTGKAALFCLGRSQWLASFAQHHLKECFHFKVMFYDEFLDVICQDIVVQRGFYISNKFA